jgi:DNA-binding transcriptional MerR regulator
MNDRVWTIGEMCAEFAVTARTLRFYESKELIAPLRQGTRRLFTRRCRGRLTLILQGKRFGFALEEIRELLDLYDIGDQGATQLARTLDFARARLVAMERQRDDLIAAIGELRERLADCEHMIAGRGTAVAAE